MIQSGQSARISNEIKGYLFLKVLGTTKSRLSRLKIWSLGLSGIFSQIDSAVRDDSWRKIHAVILLDRESC